MRALSNSNKNLVAVLSHTYEEEWTDEIGFKKLLETQDLLFTDYLESVQNTVIEPMNAYLASFAPLKVRTAKRGRKMMDFDNARHNLEVLQAAKKKDEAKINKAQEELNESRQIFDELHSELCTELPNFYNNRVTFYADLFQKLYNCENTLHRELARTSQGLSETSEKLSKDHVQFVYTPKRPLSKSLSDNSDEHPVNGESSPRGGTDSPASSASPAATPTTPTAAPRPTPVSVAPSDTNSGVASAAGSAVADGAVGGGGAGVEDGDADDVDHLYGNQDAVMAAAKVNGDAEVKKSSQPAEVNTPTFAAGDAFVGEGCHSALSAFVAESLFPTSMDAHNGPESPGAEAANNVYEAPPKGDEESDDEEDSAVYQTPPSNKPVYEPPPNTLYQVESTHTYNGEDIDELSFEPGDIIYVVPFDNEEEQDDGWQMGILQKDGLKGVFPENFTKRLDP